MFILSKIVLLKTENNNIDENREERENIFNI